MAGVTVYYRGAFVAAVCAPTAMLLTHVIAEVERLYPCPTNRGWKNTSSDRFSDGQESPCPCNRHPESHRHWLLDS